MTGMVSHNKDGSEDYGVMQVNSRWLPALSAYTGLSREEVRSMLVGRPCFNIAAGGAIMRTYLDETPGDFMRAIGNYHSHTAEKNQSYRIKVLRSATELFVQGRK